MPRSSSARPWRPWQAIADDRVLRYYGVAVSLLLVLTSVHWIERDAWQWLLADGDVLCWPMFEACHQWRVLGPGAWKVVFWGMGAAGLLTAGLFLSPRWVGMAWVLLLALNVIKYGIILTDFHLRLNQHLMALWMTAAFLFIPGRRTTLKLLVILFYFWAGTIKLHPEWLSGAALYARPWLVPESLLPVATAYVVVLELVLVWGLLWDRTRVAWLVLAQLVLFHLLSFPVVGFFYPLLMLCLLSIFPLSWLVNRDQPTLAQQIRRKQVPRAAAATALLFSGLQLWPVLIPGDAAVTGEGRLLSLHMFDSLTACEAEARIKTDSGRVIVQDLYQPMAVRIHCDPVVYLSRARNICRWNADNPHFVDVDLHLASRRSTDDALRPLVALENVCHERPRYALWRPNAWILR